MCTLASRLTVLLACLGALSLVACEECKACGEDTGCKECKACEEDTGCKECKPCKKDREDEELLCEKGDERCEVDGSKCVVGYDGDCPWGQVCYGGEGAPRGKRGTCTDGRFNLEGKLMPTLMLEDFLQEGKSLLGPRLNLEGECFFECPLFAPPMPFHFWAGKAPATVKVRIQGPNAQAEQLKVAVRGVEREGCVKTSSSLGRQGWECSFLEGWAGTNTREPLELNLWTENTFPWTGSFFVDTRPLELNLEAHLEEGFLEVSVNKRGVPRNEWTLLGAPLDTVHYFELKVFRNGTEMPIGFEPKTRHMWFFKPDHQIQLPADFEPTDTLEVHATVSAQDRSGNKVAMETLETTLEP